MDQFPELEKYLNSMEWESADRKYLVNYWADAAANDPISAKSYFKGLIASADLTPAFKRMVADPFEGNSDTDAGRLFQWAWGRGVNPKDERFTTLGSILLPTLENAGADQALKLAALIAKYKLIVKRRVAEEFARRYQIPVAAPPPGGEVSVGPEFRWEGPNDEVQLQRLFGDEPADFYVKFMMLVVTAAAAVCRIEIDRGDGKPPVIRGTGFLIAPNLVLTNYHVLGESDEGVAEAAKRTKLRFGALTNVKADDGEGQVVPVTAALVMSPTAQDDFVLLEADSSIRNCSGLVPAVLSPEPQPSEGAGLHILHHPGGDAMKVSISKNGVSKLLPDQGKIQYFGKTLPGSSGAPCFNDQFQVVAIHHAVRSRFGGLICQGILISAVRDRLEPHL
jgi:hypothetical protein